MQTNYIRPVEVYTPAGFYEFTKTVSLDKNEEFTINVFSSGRYILTVNGEYICEGPCKGHEYVRYYDTVNSVCLKKGENLIKVTLMHENDGKHFTSVFQSEKPELIFEALSSDSKIRIASDTSWKCEKNEAMSFMYQNWRFLPPYEHVDMSLGKTGYALETNGYFDFSYGIYTFNGIARGRLLYKRPIPMLYPHGEINFKIVKSGKNFIELDAGKYVTAKVFFEFNSDICAKIIYAECYMGKDGNKYRRDDTDGIIDGYFDTFISQNGESYSPFWFRSFRFIRIEADSISEKLKSIKAKYWHYPLKISGKIDVNHHDMGFLFGPSCVSYYKITNDKLARDTALMAANHLITRYSEKGGFIQAWGSVKADSERRLIIDCLLNIPLLFWAAEEVGDEKFYSIASSHLKTALSVLVRDDFTTHHTYFFDSDGNALYGRTVQGFSDNSCWARGQAWGVSGTALNYKYVSEDFVLDNHNNITDTFIKKLPDDFVPYWDMDFTKQDNEPRDTSAAAIAACGILEMNKYRTNKNHLKAVSNMLESLIDNFLTKDIDNANGILSDGMYNRNAGHKSESTIWGDYFFMEALARIKNPDIELCW